VPEDARARRSDIPYHTGYEPHNWAMGQRIRDACLMSIVLTFVAFVVATCSSTAEASPSNARTHNSVATPATKVVTYNPFTPTGTLEPTLKVVAVKSGVTPCQSSGAAGWSSFRCFTNPEIYDPCFAPPSATTGPVYCPVLLPRRDVVEVRTGQLPPLFKGGSEYRPWALELSDGQVCEFVNAAWGGLGPFGCVSPPGKAADCRVPTANYGRWTTLCQKTEKLGSPFTEYRVSILWK